MPANPKYLNNNPWHQFAKISSGILGGFIISALIHVVLALVIPFKKEVVFTSAYSFFVIWTSLIIIPFLFKNGWMAWVLYTVIISVLVGVYLLIN